MSGLESIPISVEAPDKEAQDWGNALPVLHEVRHALQRLTQDGERTVIDLRAIPFGPGDEDRLLALLGRGEVEARLDAFGPTRIWETAIPGVWLVDHRNADDERIALHVEIAPIPEILHTQPQDLQDALPKLEARIAAGTRVVTKHSPDN